MSPFQPVQLIGDASPMEYLGLVDCRMNWINIHELDVLQQIGLNDSGSEDQKGSSGDVSRFGSVAY